MACNVAPPMPNAAFPVGAHNDLNLFVQALKHFLSNTLNFSIFNMNKLKRIGEFTVPCCRLLIIRIRHMFRERPDHFEQWSDTEFHKRFRLLERINSKDFDHTEYHFQYQVVHNSQHLLQCKMKANATSTTSLKGFEIKKGCFSPSFSPSFSSSFSSSSLPQAFRSDSMGIFLNT
ncbi:hypothetical protein FF38_00089 [Lucilia cuprina]|uniref:Uncharacterized protein n=1 Tax=Lucilia cuprina TaxID=7375 RepID=A0A0L0BL26_LUCCU|nr:hypothetical protein FF38_00089 [Lucilia cuprina]